MKRKHFVAISITVIVLLAIPIIFWGCIKNSFIAKFILEEWSTTPIELWESVIAYLSMGFTLLLGVIVYYQSQKINALESSQYDIFVGIDRLDYSLDFKDALIKDCDTTPEFSIIQSFSEEGRGFLTSLDVHMDNNLKDEIVFIPLSFTTKNGPLITSLDFQKISLRILLKDNSSYQQDFYNSANPLYIILCDGSRFSFGIGMMFSSNAEISKISLCIDFEIGDQIGRTHKRVTSVDLDKIFDNFYLSSSKSV